MFGILQLQDLFFLSGEIIGAEAAGASKLELCQSKHVA
jgi:hypothetical protein